MRGRSALKKVRDKTGREIEPRAVVTSPDHRVHIGRTGKTIDEALRNAVRDAKAGCRE